MTIKSYSSVVFLAAALASVSLLTAQQENKQSGAPKKQVAPKGRTSPHETTYARVGASRSLVSITYGRPYSAKGGKGEARKIWGGLVPYGKADRLGADEATMISLQHPIVIGEKTIPAGVHALYIVAAEEGAKLAFSSNVAKWGIPVDESKDIARVDLTKEALDESVDQLTIAVENNPPTGGVLKIKWEKTQFSVPFTVKT